MPGLNTETELIVRAIPDTAGRARIQAVMTATARAMQGVRGVVGNDRGDPTRSFNGPVATAPSVSAAYARIIAEGNVPYDQPGVHDAALTDSPLGSLAAIQYQRLNR